MDPEILGWLHFLGCYKYIPVCQSGSSLVVDNIIHVRDFEVSFASSIRKK